MNTRLVRYASWAAYTVGLMSILGFVSLILFFAIEAPQIPTNPTGFHIWGPLSDIAGPLTMLPLLIVIFALHQMERRRAPMLNRVATLIGVIGAVAVTLLQTLLIIKVLSFEQEIGPVVLATALVGVWQIIAGHLGRVQQILPARLAWLGIAVGLAQAAYPVVFPMVGGASFYENIGANYLLLIITIIIFLTSYIGFPVWAIWLGRVWSKQPMNV
jgi:hypothetical protein